MPAEERYAERLSLEPGRLQRDHDEPIKVGSMLWVFTDPHRGHEFAYNRWYERDHYYAGCMIGANNFAGSRWVAPRRHREARLPAEPDMPFDRMDGTYACVYYVLAGCHEQWLEWSTPQALWLYEVDRGFNSRTHHNTGTYDHAWRAYRDPDPVPLELALDHRYPGMVAVFVEPAEGSSHAELDDWFDAYLPAWMPGSPVAIVSNWSNIPLLDTKPDFVPSDDAGVAKALQIHFVETDPLECWDHYRRLVDDVAASGLGHVCLAAPFLATVIGTDRYVDELW